MVKTDLSTYFHPHQKGGLTRLDNIHPNILHHSINLLPQERCRDMVYIVHTPGVLRRERRRGRHGVAPVGGNDFLVCLEAASSGGTYKSVGELNEKLKEDQTYAPPELSEPAMTSTRLGIIFFLLGM
jgi:hypothetical protein